MSLRLLLFHDDSWLSTFTSCIAITGLSNHPFGSWKHKNRQYMWLRDSLPFDLKETRMLLYGYDTNLPRNDTFQSIDDIATGLCQSIKAIRRNHDVRYFCQLL